MKKCLVLLTEGNDEIFIHVTPDTKNKGSQYLYMRLAKGDTGAAIYHAIKKASSLRYDYGFKNVKIQIEGIASSEMSCVSVTKLSVQ
jgi:hypothetical protein